MERTKKDLELSLLQCRGSLAAQRVTIGDYIDQEHWGHFKTNSHTTWIKHTPQDKQTHKCVKIIIAILEMQYIKCIIEGTFTFCGMLSEVGPNNEWMGQYIVTGFFCWGFGFCFYLLPTLPVSLLTAFVCLYVVACSQPLLPCPSMPSMLLSCLRYSHSLFLPQILFLCLHSSVFMLVLRPIVDVPIE